MKIRSGDNNYNIQNINKVEINIGLEKFINKDKDGEKNLDNNLANKTKNLKEILSSYYEIDKSKINIAIE